MAEQIKIVAEQPQSTVVADYELKERDTTAYQSEAEMEKDFIQRLVAQGYEYLPITTEAQLVENLRRRLEQLNGYTFTPKEWDTFFREQIANPNFSIEDKTRIIQEDHIRLLAQEDGKAKNIRLIDKEHIHNNSLQVINQYTPEGGTRENRYDVTILVNGLPLVHVELKRRGVSIKEAFNQIRRYNRESFWAGCGLFEYAQLFVISNGTQTKYYSNTTRRAHLNAIGKSGSRKPARQTSNSFEFTSYWARRDNRIISDIVDFASTFFARHTLLNILTKYCVLTSENLLLVMRPYQIAATESILRQIEISTSYKKYGTVEAGGYVWHTTGSGKTLTSFKTARLASRMEGVDKVLFVVDRKDLDYQTMREYDRFEKGAANSNTDTSVLKKQLEDPSVRIIITTIQKLSIFVSKNRTHDIYDKHIVFIFDECHRSHFGTMHALIVKRFKKYHLFGFTGTPIFAKNASSAGKSQVKTTEQAFGKQLHVYTIVDAIADRNVLPFRVEYISTMRQEENIMDEKVRAIDRERALLASERIENVVRYILSHFAQKTKRNEHSFFFNRLTNIGQVAQLCGETSALETRQSVRMRGFNSIFAVSSVEAAKLYYTEFKRQMSELPSDKRLKVATIFSYGVNEDEDADFGLLDDENSESTEALDKPSRDFLQSAIEDYNHYFGTSYDTSSDKFQNYYKDVSLRMKNRDLDLLIVVNMFLTGFDATTLNTLWVDKNLRMHGLLQAYSRTNRILNSVKTFGNVVCFRNLEEATNESLALFGDKQAGGVVLLKTFADYYNGYEDEQGRWKVGYNDLVSTLLQDYPLSIRIIGEAKEKEFIKLYGSILRLTNILSAFDEFLGKEILTQAQTQDYHSLYLDLYDKYRREQDEDTVNVNDDIVFEMELIKQVEINIDYILFLIEQYHKSNLKDKTVIVSIQKAVGSSPTLRNKRELIENFISQLSPEKAVREDWAEFVRKEKRRQLDEIIASENLKAQTTYDFVNRSFQEGGIQESGTGIAEILPPMSLFDKRREEKKRSALEKLKAFFERFFDISSCGV